MSNLLDSPSQLVINPVIAKETSDTVDVRSCFKDLSQSKVDGCTASSVAGDKIPDPYLRIQFANVLPHNPSELGHSGRKLVFVHGCGQLLVIPGHADHRENFPEGHFVGVLGEILVRPIVEIPGAEISYLAVVTGAVELRKHTTLDLQLLRNCLLGDLHKSIRAEMDQDSVDGSAVESVRLDSPAPKPLENTGCLELGSNLGQNLPLP